MADSGAISGSGSASPKKGAGGGGGDAHKFQAPKGTRDFYPADMLRKRYIVETWRAVSLRHGFEEIDGPTFEHLELYTVKSGEGIVSELFSFRREGGEDTYALRPEFTPTLARMYAEKANALSKPVRWFSVLPYFRAERPQRGRLREFLQWNCDVIGGGDSTAEGAEKLKSGADGEIAGVAVGALGEFGLTQDHAKLHVGTKKLVTDMIRLAGVRPDDVDRALSLIDRRAKMEPNAFQHAAKALDFRVNEFDEISVAIAAGLIANRPDMHYKIEISDWTHEGTKITKRTSGLERNFSRHEIQQLIDSLDIHASSGWWTLDLGIVRGLAYYTGMVFEVIAEGERAVAGGGRYDNLIELLGGPPTPAVGFAMGDVVLGNLLDDKNLMPTESELPAAVESVVRSQRIRPEIFVIAGAEADDPHVVPLVARLRRGIEATGFSGKPWDPARYAPDASGVRPLHARSTDKATRNTKKLLQDAVKQGARFFCEIHGQDKVELKDLDHQSPVDPPAGFASFSLDPAAQNYVGRAVTRILG